MIYWWRIGSPRTARASSRLFHGPSMIYWWRIGSPRTARASPRLFHGASMIYWWRIGSPVKDAISLRKQELTKGAKKKKVKMVKREKVVEPILPSARDDSGSLRVIFGDFRTDLAESIWFWVISSLFSQNYCVILLFDGVVSSLEARAPVLAKPKPEPILRFVGKLWSSSKNIRGL